METKAGFSAEEIRIAIDITNLPLLYRGNESEAIRFPALTASGPRNSSRKSRCRAGDALQNLERIECWHHLRLSGSFAFRR